MLKVIFYMEGIENPYKGYDNKDVSKDHAQIIDSAKDEMVI